MSKTSKGFIWSFIERFSMQGAGFVISILLARLIAPESYGLIVMIQVFLTFSQVIIDSGFANALIQKQNRTEVDYYTAFIFNLITAVVLYVVIFFVAPLIASFYEESKLTILTRVISLNLIISSLTIVQKARLTIALDFKTQAKASLLGVISGGVVGLFCAYNGMEVWALVVQNLLNQFVLAVCLFYYTGWKPKMQFSIVSFRQLFSFGSKMLLSNLATNIYLNIYNLVIGKKYSSAELAYYNRAFTLTQFPSVNIAGVMNRIIYPVECEVQNDIKKLESVYNKYLHLSNYIIMPLMGILIVCAEPIIKVLLTDKWIEAVPYIQLFGFNFLMYAWLDQAVTVLYAVGKAGVNLKSQILKRTISIIILLITINLGVSYICVGIAISTLIELLISLYFVKKELGFSLYNQACKLMDVVICNIGIGIVVYFIVKIFANPYLGLGLSIIVWVVFYIILTFAFRMQETNAIKTALTKLIK